MTPGGALFLVTPGGTQLVSLPTFSKDDAAVMQIFTFYVLMGGARRASFASLTLIHNTNK